MLDRAVLARRIHCLEDEQHRPEILGVENVLLHCEPFRTAPKKLRRLLLVHLEPACIAGIEVVEAEVLAVRDAEWLSVFPDGVENILARHRPLPSRFLVKLTQWEAFARDAIVRRA